MVPGKNTEMLSGHAEMVSGKLRFRWNCTWQGMFKKEKKRGGEWFYMYIDQKRYNKMHSVSPLINDKTDYSRHGEG